jgi:NHLM bacteriocin system ABC transporter ATP-binding protein
MNEPSPSLNAFAAVDAQPGDIAKRVKLDGRQPVVLDLRGRAMQVISGYVDVFIIGIVGDQSDTARHHLFRIEPGEILADIFDTADASSIQMIAVGAVDAEVLVTRCQDCSDASVEKWIARLARLIAGPNPSWEILQATNLFTMELKAGERRRGPSRDILWLSLTAGSAQLMGREPVYQPDGPPIPLSSGMWVVAGATGCDLTGSGLPGGSVLHQSLDHFHRCAAACISERLRQEAELESQRLLRRKELTLSRSMNMVDRLAAIIVPHSERVEIDAAHSEDPLLAACAIAARHLQVPILAPPTRSSDQQGFADLTEIARASRLRVRRVLLRRGWWREDAGPMVGWYGAEREPVALIRKSGRYVIVGPEAATSLTVDATVSQQLDPEAATFYPTLPSSTLKLRDLLFFSAAHVRSDVVRIALTVMLIGLASMVPPLITQALVNSVIPRTQLGQLTFCAIALAVAAIGAACLQLMESTAMLRLEGLVDWRLQAAVIDRVLKLPASLFREYTVGDFVDRALGVDAVRRILTGQTLRSLMSGLFCWFSIALMVFYDSKLALLALAMLLVRAMLIVGISVLRVHYETKQFNLQGKVEGFVLQLLASVGKLRVAAATTRALAVWSREFAVQKQHAISSQRASNALMLFEGSFLTFATMILFSYASLTQSGIIHNLGNFMAFFSAFGQSMAGIGAWANGISSSLVAIPHVTRIRPIVTASVEISDERKPPGELTGALELSRATFRYIAGGPAVLDNVSLRIGSGEYVALVGPSGSGKTSLFRLLLGFEKPESGAVFYDGKALDTLDVSAVRRQLGVVLQNGRLATGSIYENICGGVQLPLERVWAAARMAGIDEDIKKMPMGMHTAIAEGVNALSGGQRQRIMIARAVARRPRILLFDEATSSLDNRSQAIVSDALGALNVTRIVIAHRLSTVRKADRIVVLTEGKVMQSGTFAELSETKGMFADFARRQLL